MKRLILLYTILFGILSATDAIDVQVDKTTLSMDETLQVTIGVKNAPFAFLYDLMRQPETSFQVVAVAQGDALTLTLKPTRPGNLIFAPGTIHGLIVPPVSVTCQATALSALAVPRLLPLYPELRIDLSPQNRLLLTDEKSLNAAKTDNIDSIKRYHMAWDSLAYAFAVIGFGMLLVWVIVYYELAAQAKRPKKVVEAPLQRLLRELQDPSLSVAGGLGMLADALREALGAKDAKNYRQMSLFEVADSVEASPHLLAASKSELVPLLNTLGAIAYAARPTSEQEWQLLKSKALSLLKQV